MQENDTIRATPEFKDTAGRIYDDASWLLNMVENLLSVTRIQGANANVKKSMEVVEEVVSESVTRLKKRLPYAQVEVSLPDDFIMLPMDAILIEQVLINLLENAVIHSGTMQPIQLTVTCQNPMVIFQVIDHGIGIDPNRLEAIFDGMPPAETKPADSKKGMGIGLSICKTIVMAHNGTITAQNQPSGAIFTFTLPMEERSLHE